MSCGLLHKFKGTHYLHLYSSSQLQEFSSDVTYFWLFSWSTKSQTTKQLWPCRWNTQTLRALPLEVIQPQRLQSPRLRAGLGLPPLCRNGWSHWIAGIPLGVHLHEVLDSNLIQSACSESSKHRGQSTFHLHLATVLKWDRSKADTPFSMEHIIA